MVAHKVRGSAPVGWIIVGMLAQMVITLITLVVRFRAEPEWVNALVVGWVISLGVAGVALMSNASFTTPKGGFLVGFVLIAGVPAGILLLYI